MNNDRFLTRVFDKQEKKMYYIDDDFYDTELERNSRIIAINASGIYRLIDGTSMDDPWDGNCRINTFKDRFIPMQCYGRNDKNGKIVYEADLVLPAPGSNIFNNKDCEQWIGEIKYIENSYNDICLTMVGFVAWPIEKCVVIGNIHESPKLKEEYKL